MDGVIRWEEPPPTTRGRQRGRKPNRLDAVMGELMSRPGEWAVVYEGPNGAAGGVAANLAVHGVFESTTRKIGGVTLAYARYVGGDSDG